MMAINIHASCVVIERAGQVFDAPHDAGVLLLGESGAGKSDLALRLIDKGARLVADDRVELFVSTGGLSARAPSGLAGLIELRGIGIVALPHAAEARIALAVQLVARDVVKRLPDQDFFAPDGLDLPMSQRPPLVRLHAFDASAPAKVAVALAAAARNLYRDGRALH